MLEISSPVLLSKRSIDWLTLPTHLGILGQVVTAFLCHRLR